MSVVHLCSNQLQPEGQNPAGWTWLTCAYGRTYAAEDKPQSELSRNFQRDFLSILCNRARTQRTLYLYVFAEQSHFLQVRI